MAACTTRTALGRAGLGDLPRTLAFFAALLLHGIPGEGQGEVSLAGGTLVQMREGLRATLSPRDSRSRTFWEYAYKTGLEGGGAGREGEGEGEGRSVQCIHMECDAFSPPQL